MKKTLLLIAGCLTLIAISGQDFHPIVQENNEWTVLVVIESGPMPWDTLFWTETYKLSGDTLLNDQSYKKIYVSQEEFPTNWQYRGGLREEDQKVWHIGTNNYPENKIYDFTVSSGDTLDFLLEPMVVDTIYYENINGSERKHIRFINGGFPKTEIWIEGIGSNMGILNAGLSTAVGGGYWLLCYKENGELVYMTPTFDNCFLTTDIIEIEDSPIQIYPNPTEDQIKLKIESGLRVESIILLDLHGGEVRSFDAGKTELDVTSVSPGVYLLRINSGKTEIIKKIIIK